MRKRREAIDDVGKGEERQKDLIEVDVGESDLSRTSTKRKSSRVESTSPPSSSASSSSPSLSTSIVSSRIIPTDSTTTTKRYLSTEPGKRRKLDSTTSISREDSKKKSNGIKNDEDYRRELPFPVTLPSFALAGGWKRNTFGATSRSSFSTRQESPVWGKQLIQSEPSRDQYTLDQERPVSNDQRSNAKPSTSSFFPPRYFTSESNSASPPNVQASVADSIREYASRSKEVKQNEVGNDVEEQGGGVGQDAAGGDGRGDGEEEEIEEIEDLGCRGRCPHQRRNR